MERKKTSVFKTASILYFIWLGLFYAGQLFCEAAGLEYRMWVWFLGKASLLWLLPLWLFVLFCRWHVRKEKSRLLRNLAMAIFVVSYLIWGYFSVFYMIFTIQEERALFDGYVAVNRATGLSESSYDLCRSKAFFFREDTEWDTAFEIEYLEKKYRQDFLEVPFDPENMLVYDGKAGASRYGETVPVPSAHPKLPVNVVLAGGKLDDDYVDVLTAWYIAEGCRELKIDRPFRKEEGWGFRLYFAGREDIGDAASDVRKLIDYAMQDEIFQEYSGSINLSPEDAQAHEYIYIPFGKVRNGQDGTENGYEAGPAQLEQYIEERYERILENRREREEREEEWNKTREEAGEVDEAKEGDEAKEADEAKEGDEAKEDGDTPLSEAENSPESEYAEEARRIYEEILEPEQVGGQFSINYNAKGQEYYPLGEDGAFEYTLIYDRDSKNGACRLYVLYRSPYDKDSGRYYSYTDSMTQIMDIYAVVKETGVIIPSGRKTWSDPGNREYREATGE